MSSPLLGSLYLFYFVILVFVIFFTAFLVYLHIGKRSVILCQNYNVSAGLSTTMNTFLFHMKPVDMQHSSSMLLVNILLHLYQDFNSFLMPSISLHLLIYAKQKVSVPNSTF